MLKAQLPVAVNPIQIEQDLGDLMPYVELSEDPRMIKIQLRDRVKRPIFDEIHKIAKNFGGVYAFNDREWRVPKQH